MTSASAEHLGRRAARGGTALVASRALGTCIGLVGTVILARLVDPAEYGAVAMVLAAMAFARTFEEIGLGDAMVQRESVDEAQRSSLFWLNAALGVVLTSIFALAAPLVARLLGDPNLTAYALALSPLFMLSAFGAQHRATLRRNFRFRAIAVSQVAAAGLGVLCGIAGGLAGIGGWALVLQQLVTSIALLAQNASQSGLVIHRPAIASGLSPIIWQGLASAGAQSIGIASRSLDTLLIGRFFGAATVGLYDRAFQLIVVSSAQLNGPIGMAVVPALSRLQDKPDEYRRLFHAANSVVAAVAFPIAAFTAVAAPAIVGVVLGPEWLDAAPILQALAPSSLMLALSAGPVWAYRSLGHTHRQFVWTLISSALAIMAMVIGVAWGPIGVAIAMSAARVVLRPIEVVWCFRGTFLRPRDLLMTIWRPAIAATAAGIAAFALDPEWTAPLPRLLVQMAIFTPTAVLAFALVPGGVAEIRKARTLVRAARAMQAGSSTETAAVGPTPRDPNRGSERTG